MNFAATPAGVSSLLTSAGYPVTERRLVDWRVRGWLPPLTRVQPGYGRGPRAAYEWSKPEVLTQVFSLVASLQLRGRMDTAALLTWFAGYDYPVDRMRRIWAEFEERAWENTLRLATQEAVHTQSSIDNAVEVMVLEAKASPFGQALSEASIRASTRLALDPGFEPRADLSLNHAELIRRDLPQWFKQPALAAFLPMIRPEQIKAFIEFIQDYWSKPKLATLIRTLSTSELETVHRDCRFVFGLYRGWLAEAIADAHSGKTPNMLALYMGPRIAWQGGRLLMLADIAVRRLGLAEQVDATLDCARQIAGRQENRAVLAYARRSFQQIIATADGDHARLRSETESWWKEDPNSGCFQHIIEIALSDSAAIWAPVIDRFRGSRRAV